MTGLTDYTAKNLLNYVAGAVAEPALPSVWLALFTGVGTDAGTGFTEVSGGAYTRVQIAGSAATNASTASGNAILHFTSVPAWLVTGMYVTDTTTSGAIPANTTITVSGGVVTMSNNAAGGGIGSGDTLVFSTFAPSTGSAPSTIQNNTAITFPTPTANWGTVEAFGLYDAASGGNLLMWDYLGNFGWLPATISAASPGVLTTKAHNYSAADTVVYSTEFGGTAPTFSQSNLSGLLAVVGPSTDTFTVTNGGTAVNTSSTGDGWVRKVASQVISTNVVMTIATNNLTLALA